jgi:hypothetical protein
VLVQSKVGVELTYVGGMIDMSDMLSRWLRDISKCEFADGEPMNEQGRVNEDEQLPSSLQATQMRLRALRM